MARHYTVTKTLVLEFECEADSAAHAEELCIAAADQGSAFCCVDCQYEVQREDGTVVRGPGVEEELTNG